MSSSINPLRRQLALALTLAPYWLAARSWASPASQGEGRMLVVLLRGGLDGLFAFSPSADPRWTSARPTLSQLALTQGLPLPGSGFVAHPALPELAALYQAGELLFCPTAGTPDVSRSHFQSQDVFELGNGQIMAASGFMARLASELAGRPAASFSAGLPLCLSGSTSLPMHIPLSQSGMRLNKGPALDAILQAHAHQPSGVMLQQALDIQRLLDSRDPDQAARGAAPLSGWPALARQMGRLLRQQPDWALSFIDLGGMDSHAAQATALAGLLRQLSLGIQALKDSLGQEEWARTRLVVMSEFGRTVQENSSAGTDHGHGGLALLAGGGLGRPRMLGDFPGLQPSALFEGRDLPVLLDWRSLLAETARASFGLSERALDSAFPGRPRVAWTL